MKIVGFKGQDGRRLGVVEGDQLIDLQAADPNAPKDLGMWLRQSQGDLSAIADLAKRAPASARVPLQTITYSLPVASPGKIVCLGLNYLE
ncbi:MAG TPA: FAA hydrolase family protein, partial [Xanthobacteraceae bacterium]|nr:FAA hydrolase family protein [Xanthobacteraceae bacterium]